MKPSSVRPSTAACVHVVDEDEALRRSLAALFRSAAIPVESYPGALDCLNALPSFLDRSGCVVAHLRMPGTDGVAFLRELRRRGIGYPVILMTGDGDVANAVRAMKAGAFDFIEKPFATETILKMVREAIAPPADPSGQMTFASHRSLSAMSRAAAKIAALSSREREVLNGLVAGKPNKVIASELGLSPRTVEMHRANMMHRLGVRTFSEVVRLAVMADLAAQDSLDEFAPPTPSS